MVIDFKKLFSYINEKIPKTRIIFNKEFYQNSSSTIKVRAH